MIAQNNTTASTNIYSQWNEPSFLKVLRLSIFSAVLFASLFGNSLVVKTVLCLPRRKVVFTYYLVTNLAIGELLNTVCLPFLVSYDELSSWIFGQALCQLISPLQILFSSVVTSTLAAIAIYRGCVFISLRAAYVVKPWKCFLRVGLSLWAFSMVVALPNFLFNVVVKSRASEFHFWCITLLPGDTLKTFPSHSLKISILVQSFVNFVLTSSIIIISYGIVMYKVRARGIHVYTQTNDRTASLSEEISLQDLPPRTQPAYQPAPETEKQNAQETVKINYLEADLFRMFYVIILVFIVCYFPYQIFFILEYFGILTQQWRYFTVVRKYAFLLTCLPSALHPLCYGLMTRLYAKAFTKLILCK